MEGIWYDRDTDEEGDEKNDACWEDLFDVLNDNIALIWLVYANKSGLFSCP